MYVLAIYTGPLLVCLAFNRQYMLLFGYGHLEVTQGILILILKRP